MQIVAAKILQTVARDTRKEDLPDDVIMVSVVLYKPNWYYKIYGYKYMAEKKKPCKFLSLFWSLLI